ncbi:MAG TPA: bifunctional phosphopantothenoylcysteine decarboxylase/phosphopantothenate--cysteine ligase CoaBC [Bacteroidales bacterium]|nr:bifunctional phosphopantothenoylcysteine decarboxylase/phosphopantothenate--cysteine ligase CoaBC [Bacteroidales bacterium]
MLKGKKILLGISGGIAAYKSAFLIRLLQKAGAEVKVVCTHNALEFITPITLETLSRNKIYSDLFSKNNDYSTEHISLTDWADIFIVAPATANIIGKLANGIADDALSTSLIAFNKKIYLAPSMNCKMVQHFAVQKNLSYLKENKIEIIEPAEGFLACGYEGSGRMEEPEQIIRFIENDLKKKSKLNGKKFLVTAGPTYEAIDPVRFIGNRSSGMMGFCIAEEIALNGGSVTLVSGPTHLQINNPLIKRIDVSCAEEMLDACMTHFNDSDITIMAAAVADYTPENKINQKIKKSSDELILKLKSTTDILAALGKKKKKNQVLIGFSLETNNELENAKNKLKRKNLDFIVLNSLNDKGAGFEFSTNKITIIDNHNNITNFELKDKKEVAKDIVNKIISLLK